MPADLMQPLPTLNNWEILVFPRCVCELEGKHLKTPRLMHSIGLPHPRWFCVHQSRGSVICKPLGSLRLAWRRRSSPNHFKSQNVLWLARRPCQLEPQGGARCAGLRADLGVPAQEVVLNIGYAVPQWARNPSVWRQLVADANVNMSPRPKQAGPMLKT